MQENQKLARCHRFRRYTLPRFFDASAAGGVVRAWGWAHRRGLASVPLRLESVMCALVLLLEAVGARGGDGRWRDRSARRRSGSRTCCRQFRGRARYAHMYSHTAGIMRSRHILLLCAHATIAHLACATRTRPLIPMYTTRNLL